MIRFRFIIIIIGLGASLLLISPGCDELVTETIKETTAGNPTAEYRIVDTGRFGDSGCLGDDPNPDGEFLVGFEDASSGPIIKWIWNFGDATGDTLYLDSGDSGDVWHIYTKTGTYTVTLSVFDTYGSDQEIKKRAVIIGQSIDSMTVSENLICPGDSITLTAHNPFGVTSWRWAFGNGTTLVDSNLVQKYAWDKPGEYEVSLTVGGDCGETKLTDTVTVLNCGVPYFDLSDSVGCATMYVWVYNITDQAILADTITFDTVAMVDSWLFNYGKGSPDFYDAPPPDSIQVTYATAGVYEISLTITTDEGGEITYYDTVTVYSDEFAFTVSPTEACQWAPGRQLLVAFTRQSAGEDSVLWDFGDGTTDTAQNPYHTYSAPGEYDVRLVAYGACDTDSAVYGKTAAVTYTDILDTAVLFSIVNDSNQTFTFTDTSAAGIGVSREWDFGDDATGTGASVIHVYPDSTATYPVKLTRTNLCGSVFGTASVDVDSTVVTK